MSGISNRKLLLATTLLLLSLLTGMHILELRAEEPRRAIVSMEMVLQGEYVTPRIHGWNYYNKPPLFNWLLAATFKIFNSFEEWVVRLPGVLSFLLTGVAIYFFSKKYLNKEVAVFAALFYLTAADILFYGAVNSGEIDLFLVLLIFLQGMAVFHFYQKGRWLEMFLISYAITAMAFLTKGVPALVYQGLTLTAWLGWQRRWRLLVSWQHLLGIVAFLIPVGGYIYWYNTIGPVDFYLMNLLKDATQKSAVEHSVWDIVLHLLVFPFNLCLILLPWSIFILWIGKKEIIQSIAVRPYLLFCSVFVVANLIIYWISPDVRNRYLYPFFPFIAILLAWVAVYAEKVKPQWLLNTVILLAIVRIGYNFTLMPMQQKELNSGLIYRDLSGEILKITNQSPVYLAGLPDTLSLDFPLLPHQEAVIPPLVPYQLPYYLTRANGHIMTFHTTPRPDTYYLAYKSFAQRLANKTVLYEFTERWNNRQMILFKIKEE